MNDLRVERRKRLIARLSTKDSRAAFVKELVTNQVRNQIRFLRKERKWSQQELASRVGMSQSAIGRLEGQGYHGYTVETLRRLAAGFDVGLTVRFVSFSQLVDGVVHLEASDIVPSAFEEDVALSRVRIAEPHVPSQARDMTIVVSSRRQSGAEFQAQKSPPKRALSAMSKITLRGVRRLPSNADSAGTEPAAVPPRP